MCKKRIFGQRISACLSAADRAGGAGTSTSSIYTRFGDKEGLFCAIVEPAASGMKELFDGIQTAFRALDTDTKRSEVQSRYKQGLEQILDYIYAHFDTFRLLLDASYGTAYQSFVNDLVSLEVEYTCNYLRVSGNEKVFSGQLNEELMHIVATAYMNGLFEVVRHNMNEETARHYLDILTEYHQAGIATLL